VTWILAAALVVGLLVIPLGLPGLWIMVGAIAVGAILSEVGFAVVVTTVCIAIAAELVEFVLVKRLTAQYGGSRNAFWGAIAGGTVGVIVGAPVPIIGSILAGLVGSFIGAGIVTYAETKELRAAHRVGWGAVVGRALSAVVKTAAGLAILVLGIAALLR
jgi:uncharacterized protein YqgC (DUF456 family)